MMTRPGVTVAVGVLLVLAVSCGAAKSDGDRP